jgi:tRNA (adenine57-N1/adenine58-N1)-methyltransferase
MEVKKVLITKEGRKFFVKDLNNDYHTEFGAVSKKDLKKKGFIKTNKGKEMAVIDASFIDKYSKIKRGAQIITRKDIGAILTETGINKESKIVDAGAGSGALALYLAHIAKEVVTYEIRKDFFKLVSENIKNLGFKNIKIKNKDINEINEKNVDLVTLDLPEPWNVLKKVAKALKSGGFIVAYNPNISQVGQFVEEVSLNENLIYLKTIELIEREWDINGDIQRPKYQPIGHTGFLSFVRRV